MKRVLTPDLKRLGYIRRQGRGSLVGLAAASSSELVVFSSGQAAGWSVPEGELLWEVHAPGEAGAAREGLVVLGSRTLTVWRDLELAATLEGHRGRVSAIELSPDGLLAVSLAEDGLRVWQLEPPQLLRELPAQGATLQLDWERRLAQVGGERWDLGSGVRLATGLEETSLSEEGFVEWRGQRWQAHEEALVACAVGESWMATAAADRLIRVGSAPEELLLELEAYQEGVLSQALSPDGRLLALGSELGTVRLLEAMSGKVRKEWQEHADSVLCLSFSPDGNWLASGSEDCLVGLVNVRKGEPRVLDGHDAGVSCLAFSGDGRLLATGSSADEIVIWDVSSGLALETLYGVEAGLEELRFSAQGLLSALYDDGSVILWETSRYSV